MPAHIVWSLKYCEPKSHEIFNHKLNVERYNLLVIVIFSSLDCLKEFIIHDKLQRFSNCHVLIKISLKKNKMKLYESRLQIVALFLFLFSLSLIHADELIVNSPLGQYKGFISTFPEYQITARAFTGIRYSKPHVAKLRFQPSVPIGKHDGIFYANNTIPSPGMCLFFL